MYSCKFSKNFQNTFLIENKSTTATALAQVMFSKVMINVRKKLLQLPNKSNIGSNWTLISFSSLAINIFKIEET